MNATAASAEGSIPEELRLRAKPPAVKRLSRRAIALVSILTTAVIFGALLVALDGPDRTERPINAAIAENVLPSDRLAELPSNYSEMRRPEREVPVLGPPLPGDLGRAIVANRGLPEAPMLGSDPTAQRTAEEQEAARVSQLIVTAATASGSALDVGSARGAFSTDTGETPFLDTPVDRRVVSADRLQPPTSPYIIQAGTVIPGALISGIRSDRTGPVSALVTANVYDSPTGRYLLIPQGARLIGMYDTNIRAGDQRVQVAWTRIVFQDGRSITLERLPASDPAGFAGLQDKVNRHWGRLFLAAGLTTLLGVAGEFGADGEDEIADTFRNSLGREADRTATRLIDRELDIPPTLTIRPGFPVRAIVQRDLVLEPQ